MKTKTLNELVMEYGANGVVIADDGNGSAYGPKGVFVPYDTDVAAAYGDVELSETESPHTSLDGVECRWESEWMALSEDSQNPYRVKIYF